MALTVDGATNHVATAGFSYDANGNMTGIPAVQTNLAPVYDIESRTGGTLYDQQNQPLDRAGVWNLYGLNGERLETHQYTLGLYFFVYNGQAIPVYFTTADTLVSRNLYFAGRLIQSNGQTVLTDRLGTVRANEAGDRASYYPYGEQQGGGMGDGREKFATYTREVASGLDYAGQRYYSPVYGRFTSADRYSASAAAGDPSTWNRYSYTGGDPVNRTDPGGQQYIPQTICGAYGCEELPGIYCGDAEPWDPGCAAYGYTDPADWCSNHPYDASCSSATTGFLPGGPVLAGTGVGGVGVSVGITIGGAASACVASVVCVGAVATVATVAVAGAVVWGATHVGVADFPLFPIQARRLVKVRASCSVHVIGTADHESGGYFTVFGVGINFPAARANAYSAAQQYVRDMYGIGYQVQHCGYYQVN